MAEPINWINKYKEKQESTKIDPTNIKARLFMDSPAKGTKPLVKGSPEWYANASGKTETTMAPWEYLMALPENAVADAVIGIGGKVLSPLIKPVAKYMAKDIPIFRKAPLVFDDAENIVLSSPTARRSTSHFTWDIPVQSHKQGNWDGELATIVAPWKVINKSKPKIKSVEPSDVILEGTGISIPTKGVSVITGSKTIPNNMTRISSEKLDNLMDNIIQARKSYVAPPEIKLGGLNLSKPYDAGSPFFKEYSNEVMRLSKEHFKQPSWLQIKALEKSTGLKTGVIKADANREISNATAKISSGNVPRYPNGEIINFTNGKVKYSDLHNNMRGLFYHPTSSIDQRLLKNLPIKKQGGKIDYIKAYKDKK